MTTFEANNLTEYLQAMEESALEIQGKVKGASHASLCGLVLDRGRPFESLPLTDAEVTWLFKLIDEYRSKFPIKHCYSNSQGLLLFNTGLNEQADDHELRYVEGYAVGVIPIPHAWLSLNGKVVDLTMRLKKPWTRRSKVKKGRLKDRVLGEFPTLEREYYGIELPTRLIHERIARTQEYGSLIDDWMSGFPLLFMDESGWSDEDQQEESTDGTKDEQQAEPEPSEEPSVGGSS